MDSPPSFELQPVLDGLPSPIAVVNGDSLVKHTNQAWITFFAGTRLPGLNVGQRLLSFVDAHDTVADSDAAPGAALAKWLSGNAAPLTLDLKSKSAAQPMRLRLHASALPHSAGSLTLVSIQPLNSSGSAIPSTDPRFELIHRNSFEAIITIDGSQRIVAFNPAAERFFGWSANEVLGKPVEMLIPPQFVEGHREKVETFGRDNVTSKRMNNGLPVMGMRRDGTLFPAEATILTFEENGHRHYTAMIQDVSRRLEAEHRLLESEEKWRAMVENSPVHIVILNRDGCVEFMSHSDGSLADAPGEIGKRMSRLVAKDQKDTVEAAVQRVFERGEVVPLRVMTQSEDGRSRWWFVHCGPMRRASGIVSAIWIASDITSQYQLEEQLRQAQKMESIGRLAGGIAHDFNNLLTIILGYADLATMRAGTGREAGWWKEVQRAGRRAADLTRQLLAFSRRQIIRPKSLLINDVIVETSKMLQRLIGEDIQLVVRLAPDIWPILADSSQIDQIVMNLAVNARDAMREGGVLTIETKNMVLDEHYASLRPGVVPGAYVMLAVSDTGHGMDAATRERLFEPFFTTKEAGHGTGLGLATVYGIVKQNNGHIAVYSEPDKGAVFKIYWPRDASASHEARQTKPLPSVKSRGRTILFVEDDEQLRSFATELLREQGYSVIDAADGVAAEQAAAKYKGKIDLLLTDVVMPRMGGRQLAAQLERQFEGLKVVYTSGYTQNAIVHHGVLIEGVNFLPKPYTPADLLSTIAEVLAGDAPDGKNS